MASHRIMLDATQRSAPVAVSADGGKFGSGMLNGFLVMEAGPARGHGFDLDDTTLDQVVAAGNAQPSGVKMRWGHPSFLGADSIGKTLALATDFRRQGGAVRADAHFLDVGAESLRREDQLYVLSLAESGVTHIFGASVDVVGEVESAKGRRVFRLSDEAERPLRAVDFVDEPAATSALMREGQVMAASTEDSSTVTVTLAPAPEDVGLREKLQEMHEAQRRLESQLQNALDEAAQFKRERALEARRALRIETRTLFESALAEGKVFPAEREFWLGESDEHGMPFLLDDGTERSPGMPVDAFRRWLETQPRKHSHPVQGGRSMHSDASAGKRYDVRLRELAAQYRQADHRLRQEDAELKAHNTIMQHEPDLYRAMRATITGRVGGM